MGSAPKRILKGEVLAKANIYLSNFNVSFYLQTGLNSLTTLHLVHLIETMTGTMARCVQVIIRAAGGTLGTLSAQRPTLMERTMILIY